VENIQRIYSIDPKNDSIAGSVLEGIVFYAFPVRGEGTIPIYRVSSKYDKRLVLTAECFSLEGNHSVNFYVLDKIKPGAVALFKVINNKSGDLLYTINQSEIESKAGWELHSALGYVYPSQTSDTVPVYRFMKKEKNDDTYSYTSDHTPDIPPPNLDVWGGGILL